MAGRGDNCNSLAGMGVVSAGDNGRDLVGEESAEGGYGIRVSIEGNITGRLTASS